MIRLFALWLFGAAFFPPVLLAQIYHKQTHHFSETYSVPEVKSYLLGTLPILQGKDVTLELAYERESPGGHHIHFTQTFRGTPIYGAGVKANLGHDGRLWSLMNHLSPLAPIAVGEEMFDPGLLPMRFAETVGAYEIYYERNWWPHQGELIPVYVVESYQTGPIHAIEAIIDARNGVEIARRDLGAYHRHHIDSSGRGRVFVPDPSTRSQSPYGPPSLVDNGDAHSPFLESLMDTVELLDLTRSGGVYRLEGPYVQIEDIQPFNFAPATSPSGDFFFTRDDPRFEDVMVYYHIDRFQRYVQSLGFTNLQNQPFRVDPHGLSNSDQSVFVSNQGNSYILLGDGGVDDAEDADVIIHEYGHALSYAAAPNTRTGTERVGLDEGIGDYVAAAYSYDISPWRWFELFNWDGHNEFWAGREINNSMSYPLPAGSSIYEYGVVWASAMMTARQQIGAQTMDQLAFEAMYANANNMTLPDAVEVILDADSMLFQGIHTQALARVFCDRGLFSSTACLAVSHIEVPLSPSQFLVRQSSDIGYEIRWQPATAQEDADLTLYNLLGQPVWRSHIAPFTTRRLPSTFPQGIYIIDLTASQGSLRRRIQMQ